MSLPNKEKDAHTKQCADAPVDFRIVHDEEFLFRAVPDYPNFFRENGSVSSAALKDGHGGVSVDRDGGRTDAEAINFFCETQNQLVQNGLKAPIKYPVFLKIKTLDVRQNGCDVDPKPITKGVKNPYHAEITQNGTGKLKNSTARKIVDTASKIQKSIN